MILLLDIGNSRIKWCFYDDHGCGEPQAAFNELGLGRVPEALSGGERPERIIAASVAGADLNRRLREALYIRWGREMEFLESAPEACGVRNGYVDPSRLGVDRWAAVVGAKALTQADVCVADCGTALTVDVVTRDGEHLGGVIGPGLAMMRRALAADTAGVVPDDASPCPDGPLGRATGPAVHKGCLFAAAGMVEQACSAGENRLGRPVTRVLTGGGAVVLRLQLGSDWRYEPDLIFKGIALLSGLS